MSCVECKGFIFGGQTFGASDTSTTECTNPADKSVSKHTFGGSINTTGSIFGGKTFVANDTTRSIFDPIFGSSIFGSNSTASSNQFGSSLAKDANTTGVSKASEGISNVVTNSNNTSTGFADLAATSTIILNFASFTEASANTDFIAKTKDNPGPGGFVGLTNQNDFKFQ